MGCKWTGAARTQAPSTTNYDVGSATWADLRLAPLLSAMEVTSLGHGPFWSPIDPVQVSMLQRCSLLLIYTPFSPLLFWFSDVGLKLIAHSCRCSSKDELRVLSLIRYYIHQGKRGSNLSITHVVRAYRVIFYLWHNPFIWPIVTTRPFCNWLVK